MPFLTISRFSLAFCSSSSAFWRSVRPCSELLVRDDALVVQRFRAAEFAAGLRQRYFGYRDARFGARKLSHLRDDLHRGDHLAPFAHHLPGLLETLETIPEIWGLISTSSRGSTLPVATTNCLSVSSLGWTIV